MRITINENILACKLKIRSDTWSFITNTLNCNCMNILPHISWVAAKFYLYLAFAQVVSIAEMTHHFVASAAAHYCIELHSTSHKYFQSWFQNQEKYFYPNDNKRHFHFSLRTIQREFDSIRISLSTSIGCVWVWVVQILWLLSYLASFLWEFIDNT